MEQNLTGSVPGTIGQLSKEVVIQNGVFIREEAVNARLTQEGYIGGLETDATVLPVDRTEVKAYIINALRNVQTTIDITAFNIPKAEISALFYGILNDNADLFFVSGQLSYSYSVTTAKITSITVSYTASKTAIDAMLLNFNKEVNKIVALVDSSMTEVEKALFVHDYLTLNTKYDYENFNSNTIPQESYNAYGVIVKKIGVCNGYALAYAYIMENKLGIECELVVSNEMGHAWNMISIGGSYYHVDVTWDDPVWDHIGDSKHSYFLLSDAAISDSAHGHYGWTSTIKATSTKYDNFFWSSVRSGIIKNAGYWYFVNASRQIVKYNPYNGSQAVLLTIPSTEYSGSLKIARLNGKLYYNSSTDLSSVNFDGTGNKKEFTPSATLGKIYGMASIAGVLKYSQRSSYTLYGWENIYTAPIPMNQNVTGISLDALSASLPVSGTKQLSATVIPSDATNKTVLWSSSNAAVASVSSSGLVTAVASGSAVVTAKTSDGGFTSTSAVTVQAIKSLNLIFGADRYATAVDISKKSYASSYTVILVNGWEFTDGLSAGPLAITESAPILLTKMASLPASTAEEIRRLGATKVIILGKAGNISEGVVAELYKLGVVNVEKVTGTDIYDTAVKVAYRLAEKNGNPTRIVLANGTVFADALSIGAYASKEKLPILITSYDSLAAVTKNYIAASGVKNIIITGGTSAISLGVENELKSMGITISRVAGADRYDTSVQASKTFFPSADSFVFTSGLDFADALAAAPYAAIKNAPILLVRQSWVTAEVVTYLSTRERRSMYVIGGTLAITEEARAQLLKLLNQ